MLTVRRVYLYLISAVSLSMLAGGAVSLAQTLINAIGETALGTQAFRQDVAAASGFIIVGLPVWLGHWLVIQRLAHRALDERTATLRRLYLYFVLAVTMIALFLAMMAEMELVLDALTAYRTSRPRDFFEILSWIVVAGVIWLYHWRVAGLDRREVGERGGSAALRRWYVYGLAIWGLLFLLNSAASLLQLLWALLVAGTDLITPEAALSSSGATMVAGLLVWLGHWVWSSTGPTAADDRRAVLRTVYLLGALGVSVTVTLVQVSQVLYYALSRALGVSEPGGQAGSLLELLGPPICASIIYGASWGYHWWRLRHETALAPGTPHQIGVRRLYRYLVALVAMALLGIGVAGVLWTLGDLLTAATRVSDLAWRENVSLYTTLAVAGLPTWLVVWRPVVSPEESAALSRRLYVYLSLIGAVLAALIAGSVAVYQLLALVLGARTVSEAVIDLVRSGAVVVTGAGIALYHWQVMRGDQRRAPAEPVAATVPAVARLVLTGPNGAILRQAEGDPAALEAAFDRIAGQQLPPA